MHTGSVTSTSSTQISALNHQVSVQRARIAELEAEVADSEMRRKRSAANNNNGGRSLRDSEDQYHKEMRLKDDLDLAKHQKLELEAALLERDSRHIAGQFDLEASELEIDRLKRRVRELDHAYKGLSALAQQGPLKGYSGTGAGTATGSAATGVKREQELEGALEAMKRVVDKLKTENDRLKRGGGGTEERRLAELEKKLQAEKKRAEGLDEENKALVGKLKGHEESVQKIVQRQQQVAVLRKQLKSKEDELAAAHEQAEGVIVERETLKKRMAGLQDKVNELEIALHKHQSGGVVGGAGGRAGTAPAGTGDREASREMQDLRNKAAAQASENDTLRAQLSDLRRNLQQLQQREEAGGAGRAAAGGGGLSAAEVQRLKEENAKLRQELSAFDLDFFEEIENLKYAHAEAVRKLRMYEGGSGGGTTGGAGRLGSHRS